MPKKRNYLAGPLRTSRKRIAPAPSNEIEKYSDVAAEFLRAVFEMEPGDYAISDESTLRDFTFLAMSDTAPAWAKIEELYGLGRIDIGSEYLLHIFAAIERGRVAN
jgi:hypothetical protein